MSVSDMASKIFTFTFTFTIPQLEAGFGGSRALALLRSQLWDQG